MYVYVCTGSSSIYDSIMKNKLIILSAPKPKKSWKVQQIADHQGDVALFGCLFIVLIYSTAMRISSILHLFLIMGTCKKSGLVKCPNPRARGSHKPEDFDCKIFDNAALVHTSAGTTKLKHS